MKEVVSTVFVLAMLINIVLIFVKARYSKKVKAAFEDQAVKDGLFHLLTCFLYKNLSSDNHDMSFGESLKVQFPKYLEENVPELKGHEKRLRKALDESIASFADERYTKKDLSLEFVTARKFPALEAAVEGAGMLDKLNAAFAVCQLVAVLDILIFMFVR